MSNTSDDFEELKGLEGLMPSGRGNLNVRVKVVLVKAAPYGRTHVLVRPLDGEGEAWIDEYTLIRREGVDG